MPTHSDALNFTCTEWSPFNGERMTTLSQSRHKFYPTHHNQVTTSQRPHLRRMLLFNMLYNSREGQTIPSSLQLPRLDLPKYFSGMCHPNIWLFSRGTTYQWVSSHYCKGLNILPSAWNWQNICTITTVLPHYSNSRRKSKYLRPNDPHQFLCSTHLFYDPARNIVRLTLLTNDFTTVFVTI